MGLITAEARRGFEQMFTAALQANMRRAAGDAVTVMPQAALSGRADQYSPLVLLTTASLRFKLVSVFRIVDEAATRACFASESAGAEDYLEALFECGNLTCGAMNRELLAYTPHLGLSTPTLLKAVPENLLAELRAEHVSHFAIHINGVHLLDAALCMRGQAQVDFSYQASEAAVESGELELL